LVVGLLVRLLVADWWPVDGRLVACGPGDKVTRSRCHQRAYARRSPDVDRQSQPKDTHLAIAVSVIWVVFVRASGVSPSVTAARGRE